MCVRVCLFACLAFYRRLYTKTQRTVVPRAGDLVGARVTVSWRLLGLANVWSNRGWNQAGRDCRVVALAPKVGARSLVGLCVQIGIATKRLDRRVHILAATIIRALQRASAAHS